MQQLFPGRYKRIVGRCTHPKCERRYADVDSLARAWKYLRLPLQVVGALIIAVLILLPTLLYMGERQQRLHYVQAIEREQQLLDSLFQVIDTSFETHFLLALDSIHAINISSVSDPYHAGMAMMSNYYHRTILIKDEVLSVVTDKAMQSQLESYANHLYSTYQTQLVEAASQWLPAQLEW
jgi:hypothetical protein